jgi:hypothetical protein
MRNFVLLIALAFMSCAQDEAGDYFVPGEESIMHRTEGADRVLESGLWRYHDQALPSYPGTEIPAEALNAMQEEICNLISLSGGTVAASAAADRSANWRQMYDRIFKSQALDSDSVGSLILDRLIDGNLDIARGTRQVKLDPLELSFSNGSTSPQIIADYSGVEARDKPTSPTSKSEMNSGAVYTYDIADNFLTAIVPRGISFYGSAHPTDDTSVRYNKAKIDATSSSLTYSWNSTHKWWAVSSSLDTGIPATCQILGISAYYKNGTYFFNSPVHAEIVYDTAGTGHVWISPDIIGSSSYAPTVSTLYFVIEFDGKNL